MDCAPAPHLTVRSTCVALIGGDWHGKGARHSAITYEGNCVFSRCWHDAGAKRSRHKYHRIYII